MAHDKVYATCENMCLEETMTKKQIEEAINNVTIKDGGVTTAKLANEAVTTAKIADYSITGDKLGFNCVSGGNICNNAVTTGSILDEAVTTEKLANGNITHEKLAYQAVCATGSYTGTGAKQTIGVGFSPSAMTIIGHDDFLITQIISGGYVSHYYDETEQGITSGTGSVEITSTGVTIDGFDEFNVQGKTYNYIAFRE